MNKPVRVIALVGSYRKGGVIDTAVDEILSAAEQAGAETARIYLTDSPIEFCRNCRSCTQEKGERRGACPINDAMAGILDEIERSDALVLASPVNFGTVTAVMKRFIERLACYAWWPWGAAIPKMRTRLRDKRAVVVLSSAAPSILARLRPGIAGLLKEVSGILGARTSEVLYLGLAATQERQGIGEGAKKKARRLGKRLGACRT
ncbi:flavodoxin family protein [bacterium]|nr:flavodoxin family protein [bacterium]